MRSWVVAAVAALVAAPFLIQGIPWSVLYPGSSLMLLFNHEVVPVASTQTLRFFNPGAIHSFFPFSYLFAKVFFLFVPSPVLVEFTSPVVIVFVLMTAVALAWLRDAESTESCVVWFAVGCLILYYAGGPTSWLWFSSVGWWELLAFLVLVRSLRRSSLRSRPTSLVALLLLASMLLGDDGVAFIAGTLVLATHAVALRKDRGHYLRWVVLSAMMFLSYEASIGFAGELYYGSYIPVLQREMADLLSFNLQFGAHLATLSLPLYQTVGSGVAFLLMFAAVPLLLLGHSLRRGWSAKGFAFPGLLLAAGVVLRISNTITAQPQYVSAIYAYVLFLILPVAILWTVYGRLGTSGRRAEGLRRSGYLLFAVVSVCVLVIATFQFNPLVPTGHVASVTDPRVEPTYVQAAGIYAHAFGASPLAVAQIADDSVLFVDPSNSTATYLLTSPLPSPFQSQGQFQLSPGQSVYYSSGTMILVSR